MSARPGRPDGLDAADYAYAAGLSRRDWAWEFLRRNPVFRETLGRVNEHVIIERRSPHLTLYRVGVAAPSLVDWGLSFRDVGR